MSHIIILCGEIQEALSKCADNELNIQLSTKELIEKLRKRERSYDYEICILRHEIDRSIRNKRLTNLKLKRRIIDFASILNLSNLHTSIRRDYVSLSHEFYHKKFNWEANEVEIKTETIRELFESEIEIEFFKRCAIHFRCDHIYRVFTNITLFSKYRENTEDFDHEFKPLYSVISTAYLQSIMSKVHRIAHMMNSSGIGNFIIEPMPSNLPILFSLYDYMNDNDDDECNLIDIELENADNELKNMDEVDPQWRISNDLG